MPRRPRDSARVVLHLPLEVPRTRDHSFMNHTLLQVARHEAEKNILSDPQLMATVRGGRNGTGPEHNDRGLRQCMSAADRVSSRISLDLEKGLKAVLMSAAL